MSDAPTQPDPYAPWRSRDYRRYAGSWFAMTFSKQVETLAVSVYFVEIYHRQPGDAALALGLMALVQALPVMLLAIAGGQIADRFDRRHVVMITFSLGTAVSAGLLVVALLGGSVPWIYILLGVGAVGQALGSPSRSALLPQLVPTELFSNAVTWNSSVFYVASVTGPVIGGLVVATSGSEKLGAGLRARAGLPAAGRGSHYDDAVPPSRTTQPDHLLAKRGGGHPLRLEHQSSSWPPSPWTCSPSCSEAPPICCPSTLKTSSKWVRPAWDCSARPTPSAPCAWP